MAGAAMELDHCKRMVARLTTLHHTVERLHAATRPADVAHVVDDIVVRTVGATACAIYEVDAASEELKLVSITSREIGVPSVLRRREAHIADPVTSGRLFINDAGELNDCAPWERTLRACIPVKLSGRVTAVIAVFGLHASKKNFEPQDIEVFDVLSRHVGVAFNTAAANERATTGHS